MRSNFIETGPVGRDRPLCRSYRLVLLQELAVRAEGAKRPEQSRHFAIGFLSDGDWEVLGSWPASSSIYNVAVCLLEDVKARGVERIKFVVADEPEIWESAIGREYPMTILLRPSAESAYVSAGQHVRAPTSVDARSIRAAKETARILKNLVCRSLSRHGAFSGTVTATSCIANAFARAEKNVRGNGAVGWSVNGLTGRVSSGGIADMTDVTHL